jgi:hypothetical protein
LAAAWAVALKDAAEVAVRVEVVIVAEDVIVVAVVIAITERLEGEVLAMYLHIVVSKSATICWKLHRYNLFNPDTPRACDVKERLRTTATILNVRGAKQNY